MTKLMQRLKEPSTYAGLSALAVLVGVPPGTADALMQALGAVAALVAILLPERGGDHA